jgi:CHRD domain
VRRRRLQMAAVVAVAGVLGVVAAAGAGGQRDVREHLKGYEEVPSVSTIATGEFRARVRDSKIDYTLSWSNLEGDITQSHIHFGQERVNGGISAFLCFTTQTVPEGTPRCEGARQGTVTGTIEPSDVIGPAGPGGAPGGQGIRPGEYNELLRAIRAGLTYANVHSTVFPGGEIRAQLEDGRDHDW